MADWESLEGMEAAARAVARDPRRYPIGYFGGDEASIFLWFTSEDEMFRFIATKEPEVYEYDPEDAEIVREEMESLLDGGTPDLTPELLGRVNDILDGEPEILWWGRFEDLTRGISPFAIDLRERFLDDGTAAPIPDERLDDFIEWLIESGSE
ncbi:MAG TPA: hypothetical protein VM557_11790 [Thermoanaerobaculia bacterium]|nr:hypothetical protein [Thermoanaerobaculia bacterium]